MHDIGALLGNERFLEAFRESLETGGPPPLLNCAKIKLTSRCNLRCTMCKYWQTETEEVLSSERWQAVFGELRELGCRKVHFSGGEVFLRPDFLDLAEAAVGLGLKVNLTTNGTLLSKDSARRLARMGVNGVSVSLDGATRKLHNRVRGRDYAYRRTLRALGWLRRYSPDLTLRVNFVLMRTNYEALPEMVRLAGELGANDLLPMPVDEKGPRRLRLSSREIRHYNREIAPRVAELRGRDGFTGHPAAVFPFGVTEEEIHLSAQGLYARGFFERRACLAPWLHAFFAWDGATYLCCMTNGRMESLGNVGRQSVREVFHGEGFRRVRADFQAGRHLPTCHRCDLFLAENARLHDALETRVFDEAAGAGASEAYEPAPPGN